MIRILFYIKGGETKCLTKFLMVLPRKTVATNTVAIKVRIALPHKKKVIRNAEDPESNLSIYLRNLMRSERRAGGS
jgi:hypothetical protein